MRYIALIIALSPLAAFAAGDDSSTPPSAPKCTTGKVFDTKTQKCVRKTSHLLDDGERLEAVREYAYAGQGDAARGVLDAMQDQQADAVLTYRGFLARMDGDMALANRFYTAALAINPDNILTRSYMGQGMVKAGDIDGAVIQLAEIRARGGQGTWADTALDNAIRSGTTYRY